MAAVRVSGRVESASGGGVVGARVSAELSAGPGGPVLRHPDSGFAKVGRSATLTDRFGDWALMLVPNGEFTPAGSTYLIAVEHPGREPVRFHVSVPAGPSRAADIMVDAPGGLPSAPLAAHEARTGGAHGMPAPAAIALKSDLAAAFPLDPSEVTPEPGDKVLIRISSGGAVAAVKADRLLFRMFPSADAADNTARVLGALADGQRVELAGGSWPVNRLTVPSGTRLGMTASTLIPKASAVYAPISVGVGVSDVWFHDVVVDGGGTHQMSMQLSGCSGVTVEGGRLSGAANWGLRFDEVTDLRVVGTHVTGCGGGALSDAGVRGAGLRVSLVDVESTGNAGCGFRLQRNVGGTLYSHVVVSGCRAAGNYWHGFSGGPSPGYSVAHVSLSGCVAHSNLHGSQGSGFNLSCMDHVSVSGCHAAGNGEHGFVLQDLAYASMFGCHSVGASSQGLRIQTDFSRPQDAGSGVRHASVWGCHFVGNSNATAQVSVEGNCSNVRVVSSSFVGGRRPFVVATRAGWSPPSNVHLDGNHFEGGSTSNVPLNAAGISSFTGSNWQAGTLAAVPVP